MKRNSPLGNHRSGQMPIYNRNYGNRHSDDGSIALGNIPKKVFLEREVKTEDTLQSIALEFNVSVAELKRINNIHKDNEIHARKVLKVPSNTLSLLLEQEFFSRDETKPPEQPSSAVDVIIDSVNRSSVAPHSRSDSSTSEDVIFSAGHASQYHFTPIKQGEDSEEDATLLQPDRTTNQPVQEAGLSCNGADWGLSWPTLLALTVLLGVGGPLLYLFWHIWNTPGDS